MAEKISSEVYLLGNPLKKLPNKGVPTLGQVLAYFMYLKEENGAKKQSLPLKKLANQVAGELMQVCETNGSRIDSPIMVVSMRIFQNYKRWQSACRVRSGFSKAESFQKDVKLFQHDIKKEFDVKNGKTVKPQRRRK